MKSEYSHRFSIYYFSYITYRNVNIISYKESFFEEGTSSLCIIMDLADGGDLYQKIVSYKKKGALMPEREVWHYFV